MLTTRLPHSSSCADLSVATRVGGILLRALLVVLVLHAVAAAAAESPAPAADRPALTAATFAGGCFWCMEPPFDALDGVISTTSGYTGGQAPSPTYEQVSAGRTGHLEAVRVVYDKNRIGYDRLLEVFWRNIDPLDAGGQFCDRGGQYRSAIFYDNEEQRRLAERSKEQLASEHFEEEIVTPIAPATVFYPAEDYHQNYYQNNPLKYKYYRYNCGRDRRLAELWKAAGGAAGK